MIKVRKFSVNGLESAHLNNIVQLQTDINTVVEFVSLQKQRFRNFNCLMKLRHRQALKHLLKNPARISHPIIIQDDMLQSYCQKSFDFFDTFHQNYVVIQRTIAKRQSSLSNQAARIMKRSDSVKGSSKNQKTAASRSSLLTQRTSYTKSKSPKINRHKSLKPKLSKLNSSRPKSDKSKKKLKPIKINQKK